MILLDNEPQDRNRYFGKSAGTIAQLVERYSVRLDGGRFMGSGAMMFCGSSPPCVYILTAKHNLTKYGAQENLGVPAWDDEAAIAALHKKFRENVTIRVGTRTARISNIFYFGLDWTYDVCCLTTHDQDLYQLWRDVDSKLKPLLWWGDSDYEASRRLTTLLGLFAEDDEAQTLSEDNKNGLRNRYFIVQTGFGCNSYRTGPKRTQDRIDADRRGTLNHRHLTLTDYWAEGHDYDDETEVTNIFHCMAAAEASETASTAPGDSGGGVFALEKSSNGWMLAGVNLGANMHRDADNAIHTQEKAVNNVFTVLDERVLKPEEDETYTVLGGKIVSAREDEAFARFWAKGEAVDGDRESEVERTEIEPVTSG
jgi:hypothetical protein